MKDGVKMHLSDRAINITDTFKWCLLRRQSEEKCIDNDLKNYKYCRRKISSCQWTKQTLTSGHLIFISAVTWGKLVPWKVSLYKNIVVNQKNMAGWVKIFHLKWHSSLLPQFTAHLCYLCFEYKWMFLTGISHIFGSLFWLNLLIASPSSSFLQR